MEKIKQGKELRYDFKYGGLKSFSGKDVSEVRTELHECQEEETPGSSKFKLPEAGSQSM